MSTAANHASRSHRSCYKHRTAVGNLTRSHWVREMNKKAVKDRFGIKNFLRRLRLLKPDKEEKAEE